MTEPRRERVVRSEPVIPREMTAAERSALVDALLAVYSEIFEGATRDYIAHGMVEPRSEFTTILLHYNAEGRIVGYFAIHLFERRFRGVPTTIVRSSVGMLRAYRGRNANIGWALGVLLKQRLARPGRPFYGMGSMVHPSSYLQVARYVGEFWPRPDAPVPADMLAFIVELADEFGMQRVDPQQPLVRGGSMPTRETEAEREYWRRSDKPAARYFVAMNPSYSAGNGLVTMFPITVAMLAGIASRMLREKARLLLEASLAAAQRLPLARRVMRATAVRRQLRAVSLFAALDQASLQQVALFATVMAVPAGRVLVREGDEGDDLYVVARGAVAVLAGAAEDEAMIDQLGAGAMFGEIAVLAGGRRKASVRAVIPTTLVRIPGKALRAAMQGGPLGESIWRVFAARVFDDHLRATGRHRELARGQRMAWVEHTAHTEHEPGTQVLGRGDAVAYCVVLQGAVMIEQGESQLSAQAPVVVEIGQGTRITARSRVRVVAVPPRAGSAPVAAAAQAKAM